MNGSPRPRAKTADSTAPRAAVASLTESMLITARVGPTQGVQPRPKRKPSSGRRGQPDRRHLVDAPVALEEAEPAEEGQARAGS